MTITHFDNAIEFIYCACGCQKTIPKYQIGKNGRIKKYRPRKCVKGHESKFRILSNQLRKKLSDAKKGSKNPNFGKPMSEEQKRKISQSNKGINYGEKNGMWVGDNVKKGPLHSWVRRYFPPPELCMLCQKVPPYDLANITGIYNREFKNWAWFCRRCNLIYDNVPVRTKITKRLNKSKLFVPFSEWEEPSHHE